MILLTVLRGNRLSWNASSWCNAFWFDFNAVCRYTLEDSLASQHDLVMLGSYFTAALLHLMASKNFSIPKRNAIHTQKKVSNSWNIPNTEQYDSQHMLNSSLIYGSRIQWKCMDAVNSTPCLSIDRSQETPSFIQLSIKLWLLFELFSMQFFFQSEYFFLLCSFDKIIWMSFHSLLTSWNLIGVETVNVLHSVCAGVCVYALLWGRAAKWDLCASTQCHFCC